MVKHTQTIRRQQPKNCLSVFVYFVGLPLKGVKLYVTSVMELSCKNSQQFLAINYFRKKTPS